MKSTKRFVSILLSALMATSCLTAAFVTVNAAATSEPLGGKYSTNPNGNVGVKKTISVDGDISDWDSSMLIAQGTANDDPRVYRPNSMYENPIDGYALYACWDDSNLYFMWEYTNVQDVVAPNDTFPISQGNLWISNLPVFIALDTNANSGGDGTFDTGATIWDSGITFDEGVDSLVAFSTNGSNGPFIYNADKTSGKFDYDTVIARAETGISLKWGNGILEDKVIGIDKAYGTYNDRVPGDVLSEDSAWVDFNTLGHNSDSLDMHYEISVPLKNLGITSSDLSNNGVGAMILTTFGTSPMDSLPFDPAMYDNADLPYSKQENNSHEKEDEDHITVPFARIGKLRGDSPVPQPTTSNPETQPTTEENTTKPTTSSAPVPTSQPLTVNAKSNLFATTSMNISGDAKNVTVSYDLKSTIKLVNGQWELKYDSSKLSFDPNKNKYIMPYISGAVVRSEEDGVIKGNFTNITNLFDFTTEKPFVKVTFDVVGTGATDVLLNVEELSAGYFNNKILNFKNVVVNSIVEDLSKVPGFETMKLSGKAVITDKYEILLGDVNGDGRISVNDATLIQKSLASFVTLTDEMSERADVNGDGRVSIADATLIQKYCALLIDSF